MNKMENKDRTNMGEKKKIALYIHIPFCVQKCLYCDFLSAAATIDEKESYVQALLCEMDEWKDWMQDDYKVESVFIGGGTPTALSAGLLDKICQKILSFPGVNQDDRVEFTIEANPGTITKEQVDIFVKNGVNRVSLGLQSAQEKELNALGRIHSYQDFLDSVSLLQKSGINNLNVDLMADIPYQTLTSYRDTLERICCLELSHISSYSLIVEPGTPFFDMQQRNELPVVGEEDDRAMYEMTQEILRKYGYHRYEISNYAKKEKECRHNITYWTMGEYLGMGLGASSYMNGFRFQNVSSMQEYIKRFAKKEQKTDDFLRKSVEVHRESQKDAMEEFMFLGLRMCQGISKKEFQKRFGSSFDEVYGKVVLPFFQQKLLAEDENHDRIYLTNAGIDVSNTVLAEFLL